MTGLKASLIKVLVEARDRLEPRLVPSSRADLEPEFLDAYTRCRPYTMTSLQRMYGLYQAVHYIVRERIPGDIVECGVWRGGSSMLAATALTQAGDYTRHLHLYDTFEGMPPPTAADGSTARNEFASQAGSPEGWLRSPLEEVKHNMSSTGFASERVTFVVGKVETSLPQTVPDRISLLRLDTDWYESTLHELTHLYPLLSPGGILIIDDYGFWDGARRAVEEYFSQAGSRPLLTRLDRSARLGVKHTP